MRLMRLGEPGSETPVVESKGVYYDASPVTPDFEPLFWKSGGFATLNEALLRGDLSGIDVAGHARRGAPIQRPGKIVCVGLNYAEHVVESSAEMPNEPVLFMKPANTVSGPDDDVLIPPDSTKTDYEVELAVVIGEESRYLPDEAAAIEAVAGYAVSNDISERHYQLERGGQWIKGKAAETFNPLGPAVVSADEIVDPQALSLSLSVNGEVRQSSNTSDMIFSVAHIVWYLSQFMILEPGDVINTGTPQGVALGIGPEAYLKDGDLVELSIDGLGTQRQRCRQATR